MKKVSNNMRPITQYYLCVFNMCAQNKNACLRDHIQVKEYIYQAYQMLSYGKQRGKGNDYQK